MNGSKCGIYVKGTAFNLKKKVVIYLTWINLEDIILNELHQLEKENTMIPLMSIYSSHIHRNNVERGFPGAGVDVNVNILSTTEWYTYHKIYPLNHFYVIIKKELQIEKRTHKNLIYSLKEMIGGFFDL